jgi:ATP-dependent RNA helicase RhlE
MCVEDGNTPLCAWPNRPHALFRRIKDCYVTALSFASLGLIEPLQRALAAENYTQPTPIQAQAIPPLLAGRDCLGIAQTGTGKTAAFGLALLQRLHADRVAAAPGTTRSLILAPTRELAVQIGESLRTYGRHLGLKHAMIIGGVSQNKQIAALKRGVDILVATPGRLLDLINQKFLKLDAAKTLVIDEADRMFDMGFIRDVRRIVSLLPRARQSMLFSATMPDEVAHLVKDILKDPVRVDVAPPTVTADRIQQTVHFVDTKDKRTLLIELLREPAMKRVIVFTRTKHGANKLSESLDKAGHSAGAIHGNKSQNARQRALEDFRSGRMRVLVATDIAARGIDIDGITHVVNYELPHEAENYVHRIGRTARAGAGGIAIAFCDPSERGNLRDIERLVKQPLTAMGDGVRPAETTQAQPRKPERHYGPKPSRNRHRHRRPRYDAKAHAA